MASDAHAGLADAREEHLTGVPWQRCRRHFLMNAVGQVPKAEEMALHRTLRRVWVDSTSWEHARSAMTELARNLEE